MAPRVRTAAIGAAILALSSLATGSVLAASQSSDEAALQPTRTTASSSIEAKVNNLVKRMTARREAATGAAALRRAGQEPGRDHQRAARARRPRLGLQPDRPGEDQPAPACRGRRLPPAHPDPVRLRHDPRLPHDLPDPAGRREQLRPVRGRRRRHGRRAGDSDRRHQADLQPDGRRLARTAMGTDRRGGGEDPYLGSVLRGSPGQGRPGPQLRRTRTRW